MAIGVLILGESGSGKSYSMRNFKEEEVKVISVVKPILPFKNHFEMVRTNDADKIIKELKATKKKCVVIDDFQYILGLATMRRSLEKGWDKFSEMQYDYFKILDAVKDLPDDMIIYFLSHTETDDEGNTKIKTIGKALDKYITIEGMFMVVLGTKVADGKYYFATQTSGKDTLKTPAGMFPSYAIDNDLKYVDEKIRNYYEIGEFLSDKDMAEIDEAAKKVDVIKDGEKKKRRRGTATTEQPAEEKQTEEEKPKRTRRRKADTEQVADAEQTAEEREKEREEIQDRNSTRVANAGLENGENPDGVDFETLDNPDLEKLPRRKRRKVEEPTEETPTEEPTEAEPTEQPAEEKPRRRRRRAE